MIKEHGAQLVGIRLTASNLKKLNRLTKQTYRSRSELMNLLLAQADLGSIPDVRLTTIMRASEVPETVDVAG